MKWPSHGPGPPWTAFVSWLGAVLLLGLGGDEIKMTLLWFPGPAWSTFGSWLGAMLLLGVGGGEIKVTLLWFPMGWAVTVIPM